MAGLTAAASTAGLAPLPPPGRGVAAGGAAVMFRPLEEKVEDEIHRGLVSDVCFGVGAGEEARLYGSRSALALASPVFHAMFFAPHGHREAPSSLPSVAATSPAAPIATQTYVAVKDVEPEALRCMLRYVHHLDPRLTLDNALHVYRAADKYQIEGLLGACAAFLDAHVDQEDVDQVLRLFDVSCRLGLEQYSRWFLGILGELSRVQTSRLLNADEFWVLHAVSVAALLRYEGFCVDEEPLWLSLRHWAELRLGSDRRPELSPEESRDDLSVEPQGLWSCSAALQSTWQDVLRPLKALIRFPAMSTQFFANQVAPMGVLTPAESVDIFRHLAERRGSSSSAAGGRTAATFPGSGGSSAGHASASASATGVATDDATALRAGGDTLSDQALLVGGVFRADSRAPQLQWGAAPGIPEVVLDEDCGVGAASALGAVDTVVMDGRGLAVGPWGSKIILGGPGSGFHFAFASQGFSVGRHAWTITWRPLDAAAPGAPRGQRGGCGGGRGGAAGLAIDDRPPPEAAVPTRSASGTALAGSPTSSGGNALAGGGFPGFGSGSVAFPGSGGTAGTLMAPPPRVASPSTGVPSNRVPSGSSGGAGMPGGGPTAGAGAAQGANPLAVVSEQDPSARFIDWPSCIVFGVKRDVSERRYVAWDPDLSDGAAGTCVKFAIVLDLCARTVTYMADHGERHWVAPLAHEGRVMYPVIAASGAHLFHVQYGVHL